MRRARSFPGKVDFAGAGERALGWDSTTVLPLIVQGGL